MSWFKKTPVTPPTPPEPPADLAGRALLEWYIDHNLKVPDEVRRDVHQEDWEKLFRPLQKEQPAGLTNRQLYEWYKERGVSAPPEVFMGMLDEDRERRLKPIKEQQVYGRARDSTEEEALAKLAEAAGVAGARPKREFPD